MFKNINGCNIHYEMKTNQESAQTPMLLLHGWGCDAEIFAPFMDSLQKHASLITLDFPAHGQSDEPQEPWGVGDFTKQMTELLDALGIHTVDIIAHSFGARVAVTLASQSPERVNKIVITGGAGVKKPAQAQDSKRTARYKRLRAAAQGLSKLPLLDAPMKKAQERLIQKYGSWDYAALSEGMRPTFVKIITEDLTPKLRLIKSPVLLIWGGEDTETPLWMGETMESEIPDAGLVVFEGRSHFAFLEESARFLTIVTQFFWGGAEE